MRHEAFPPSPVEKGGKTASERREEALVSDMADVAAALLADKKYDAPHHIWQAFSQMGIREEAERSKYFGKVQAELGRREACARHKANRLAEQAKIAGERLAWQVRRDAARSPAAQYEAEERLSEEGQD